MLAAWVEQFLTIANEIQMRARDLDNKKDDVRKHFVDIIEQNDEQLSKRHAVDKMNKAYEKFKQFAQVTYKKKMQTHMQKVTHKFNHTEIYKELDDKFFFEVDLTKEEAK